MKNKIQENAHVFLGFALGVGWLCAIGTTYRMVPVGSYQPSMIFNIISAFFLLVFFINRKIFIFAYSASAWVFLFILILLQPILHKGFAYQDALIYPMGAMLLAFFVHSAIASLDEEEKKSTFRIIVIFIIAAALVTTLSQWLQWTIPYGEISKYLVYPLRSGYTAYGNIGQRNEAAYINTLGIIALFYISSGTPKNIQKLIISSLALFLASGVALSGSRGAVVLLFLTVAVFSIEVILTKKHEIKFLLFFALLIIFGYLLGLFIFEKYNYLHHALNAIEYAKSARGHLRVSLLKQAAGMFLDNPLFGQGWKSFAYYGLRNFNAIDWYAYSDNSHFFLSMIAAEFGLLGFLSIAPVCFYTFRSIINPRKFFSSGIKSCSFGLMAITLAYSCYDFPLWYVYYFIMFVGCLAFMLDNDKRISLSFDFSKLAVPASAVALAFCSWSFYTFIDISSIEYIMAKKNLTEKEKLGLIADTKFAYGQSRYQELYLFSTMPLSNDNLADRLDMGRRVTSSFASEELFVKQAVLLALNKEKDESLFMFNAACKINDGVDCNNVKSTVKELIQNYPAYFLHMKDF